MGIIYLVLISCAVYQVLSINREHSRLLWIAYCLAISILAKIAMSMLIICVVSISNVCHFNSMNFALS